LPQRKSSISKKIKVISKSEEELKNKEMKILHSFGFSISLLNLFRDPIFKGHEFEAGYLAQIASELRRINNSDYRDNDEMVIYMHLIVAQIDNLYNMEEFGKKVVDIVRFNAEKWNHTNIMNVKCIIANLRHFQLLDSAQGLVKDSSTLEKKREFNSLGQEPNELDQETESNDLGLETESNSLEKEAESSNLQETKSSTLQETESKNLDLEL
jgi:hypothetical protein